MFIERAAASARPRVWIISSFLTSGAIEVATVAAFEVEVDVVEAGAGFMMVGRKVDGSVPLRTQAAASKTCSTE